MTVDFEIEGQKFLALNGGPIFKFNFHFVSSLL
jgi:predicted 3-demethylubiquinone-9 3-methyltransferase (glyoxalase superfamily)